MTRWPRCCRPLLQLVLAWCVCAGPAFAHKGSDAYLDVQQVPATGAPLAAGAPATRELRFTLAVAIKDLDLLVPMDANSDGKVTWGEARAAMPLVTALANAVANLEIPAAASSGGAAAVPAAAASGGPCHLDWQPDGLDRRGDGTYVRLAAKAVCPAAQPLVLHYTMLLDQDANHRLLIAGRVDGKDLLTTTSPQRSGGLVLAGAAATAVALAPAGTVPAPAATSGWSALRVYFELGVQHLLRGYDHLAFLLALVLPLQLVLFAGARPGTAGGVTTLPADTQPRNVVWWALLRTVTAFTIGHSITLMLATFGWTQVSPRWVEPAIALTIVVTALLNLRPLPWIRTDVLALLFGMVHGIGFAGLLQEAAAPSGLLPWALAGFNLGVEAGQLIVVCAWVLLCQPAVGRSWYGRVVVRGGSVLLALLAAFWFWQRVH